MTSRGKRSARPPRAKPAREAPALHPIQVVARRTGLSLDLLRAWEKRYAAVTPVRTPGGRRLYSDPDVERLRWLKRAVDGGRSIGQVAPLETGALRRLVEADAAAERAPTPGPSGGTAGRATGSGAAGETLDDCLAAGLDAVERLDARGLEDALARAAVAGPRPALYERLLVPLMRTIGNRWHDGTLRIAHEHLATSVLRSFVGGLGASRLAGEGGPELVAATPSGQLHEMGVLIAAAAAADDGWRVAYLGANLPAEEIAAAVRARGARAVLLGLVYPPDDGRLVEQLTRLRRLLADGTAVLIGGGASDSYAAAIDGLGFTRVQDLAAMRRALESLRRRPLPA